MGIFSQKSAHVWPSLNYIYCTSGRCFPFVQAWKMLSASTKLWWLIKYLSIKNQSSIDNTCADPKSVLLAGNTYFVSSAIAWILGRTLLVLSGLLGQKSDRKSCPKQKIPKSNVSIATSFPAMWCTQASLLVPTRTLLPWLWIFNLPVLRWQLLPRVHSSWTCHKCTLGMHRFPYTERRFENWKVRILECRRDTEGDFIKTEAVENATQSASLFHY